MLPTIRMGLLKLALNGPSNRPKTPRVSPPNCQHPPTWSGLHSLPVLLTSSTLASAIRRAMWGVEKVPLPGLVPKLSMHWMTRLVIQNESGEGAWEMLGEGTISVTTARPLPSMAS